MYMIISNIKNNIIAKSFITNTSILSERCQNNRLPSCLKYIIQQKPTKVN